MAKPKQIDALEILNEDDRIFKSWGTVEVRDKEGQMIPMDEIKKIMPTLMDRGGIITDRHSNRVVAKILNFEYLKKETPEGLKDGIYITGKVFKNYQIDDMVWEGIKSGIYKGLSFGGRNHQLDIKYEKGLSTEVLKQLEGLEYALVPGMGNQEATMEEINYFAKCDKELRIEGIVKKELNDADKKELEEENEKIRENGKSEEAKKQHKFKPAKFTHPNGHPRCLICGDEERVGGTCEGKIIEKRCDTDDKDKEKTLTKNNLSLSQSSDKAEKYLKKSDLNNNMEENVKKEGEVIETPATPEAPTNPMEEIKNMLSQILQAVSTPAPAPAAPAIPVAKEEDEEKDKDKDKDEDVDKEEKVTLPKTPEEETGEGKPAEGEEKDKVKFVEKKDLDVMKNEMIAEIKKGLLNVSVSTPRPANEIKKTSAQEAPKNWKDVEAMVKKRI